MSNRNVFLVFPSHIFKKEKEAGEIHFNNIFYWSQYTQNIIILAFILVSLLIIALRYFVFEDTKSSKYSVYFTLRAHFKLSG